MALSNILFSDITWYIHNIFSSFRILEGGFAAASVLISLGAVLGKLNPFQILLMSLIETPVYILNSYIGYSVLGVTDIGNIYCLEIVPIVLQGKETNIA